MQNLFFSFRKIWNYFFCQKWSCQKWFSRSSWCVADGCLAADAHPLLCVELFGVFCTIIGPPQQIQQLLPSHALHSNPRPAAGEEICERLTMLHLKSPKITAVKVFDGSFYCRGAFLVQKEQQLGDRHFEDRSQQLKELPSLSTDFYVWLKLTVSIRPTPFSFVLLSECCEECLTSRHRCWEKLTLAEIRWVEFPFFASRKLGF